MPASATTSALHHGQCQRDTTGQNPNTPQACTHPTPGAVFSVGLSYTARCVALALICCLHRPLRSLATSFTCLPSKILPLPPHLFDLQSNNSLAVKSECVKKRVSFNDEFAYATKVNEGCLQHEQSPTANESPVANEGPTATASQSNGSSPPHPEPKADMEGPQFSDNSAGDNAADLALMPADCPTVLSQPLASAESPAALSDSSGAFQYWHQV